uniref:Uncharacterized protein n=1 Tax=Rhizophora mucronata TaxID=61149 RepID=A0A2P2R495_RHIMU
MWIPSACNVVVLLELLSNALGNLCGFVEW